MLLELTDFMSASVGSGGSEFKPLAKIPRKFALKTLFDNPI